MGAAKGKAMATGALKKVTAKQAREVCAQFELTEEGRALLNDQISPDAFLDLLLEHGHLPDAIRLLAFALPKREAVWWACQCVRDCLPSDASPKLVEAVKAAEAWVYKPSEETRWAAKEPGEKAGFDKAAAWAAMGAFWSGGSMVAAHLPAMAPGPTFVGVAVSGAVLLSAVQRDRKTAMEHYKQLIAYGVDIANGGTGKPRPPADTPVAAPGGAAGRKQ
jgi:hypothetical protein